jgi:hypothetical protein
MREADVANTSRTGGKNRWTPEEKAQLDHHWEVLCNALPDRSPISLAMRLVVLEKEKTHG